MNEIRKKLAQYWELSEKDVHVGVNGRVSIGIVNDKTPTQKTGIVFWDDDELYEYLEEQGL